MNDKNNKNRRHVPNDSKLSRNHQRRRFPSQLSSLWSLFLVVFGFLLGSFFHTLSFSLTLSSSSSLSWSVQSSPPPQQSQSTGLRTDNTNHRTKEEEEENDKQGPVNQLWNTQARVLNKLQQQQSQQQSQSFVRQSTQQQPNAVLVAGILDKGLDITMSSLKFLVQLSCLYGVEIIVVVRQDASALSQLVQLHQLDWYPTLQSSIVLLINNTNINVNVNADNNQTTKYQQEHYQQQEHQHQHQHQQQQQQQRGGVCAKFQIVQQPEYISQMSDRVDRLAQVRDYQRDLIRLRFASIQSQNNHNNHNNSTSNHQDNNDDNNNKKKEPWLLLSNAVVVLVDLDLVELPPAIQVLDHAMDMIHNNNKNNNDIRNQQKNNDDNNQALNVGMVDVLCAAGVLLKEVMAAVPPKTTSIFPSSVDDSNKNINNNNNNKPKTKYFVDGYYDTFATIFLPDTFSYMVSYRLHGGHPRPQEDVNLIVNGKTVTQVTLLQWIQQQGRRQRRPQQQRHNNNEKTNTSKMRSHTGRPTGTVSSTENESKGDDDDEEEDEHDIVGDDNSDWAPVPVKSCFGGLTLYRANKYLHPNCSYHHQPHITQQEKDELTRKYANRFDKRPCEHVIFHNCLSSMDDDPTTTTINNTTTTRTTTRTTTTVIAIQPNLRTRWMDPNKQMALNLNRASIHYASHIYFRNENNNN